MDGRRTGAYRTWFNMLIRCYCPEVQKKHPTYIGCTISRDWQDFQDFAAWYYNQPYSDLGYELDKDLLIPNNKIYSPDTCCFVPSELNSLLTDGAAARGAQPQGVYFFKSRLKYRSQMNKNGKLVCLGCFNCPNEAHQAYKTAKEAYVKEKALEWQDRIADDVFQALMNWALDS